MAHGAKVFRISFEDISKRVLSSTFEQPFLRFFQIVSIVTRLIVKYLVLFSHLKQSELCQIQLLTY